MGELTLLQFYQNYLPVLAFISVKEFYDRHYIAFILIETSTALGSFGKIWNIWKVWIFLLGSSFTLLIFWSMWKMTNKLEFALLNTAIIIFCLIYSLNIPLSNQNLVFLPVERSISISSKFTFWRHFAISFAKIVITRKWFWRFFFLWFYHFPGRRKYKLHSLSMVSMGFQSKFLNWLSQFY